MWTVRTLVLMAGERAVLTANEKGQWDLPLDQLGFTSEQLADAKKLVSVTQGLVLVSGPRGHGRSTTMYSMLKQHDAFTNSVETLEVNPQVEIEGVTVNRFGGTAGGGGGTVAGATATGGAEGNGTYSKTLQSIMLKEPPTCCWCRRSPTVRRQTLLRSSRVRAPERPAGCTRR